MPERPIAVIDVGSNSGRLVILQPGSGGNLETLEEGRAALRLVLDTDAEGALTDAAIERSVDALRDFVTVASGAGADHVVVVGTSAIREAANRREFVERVRQATGVTIEVIDGEEEARYSFLGAARGIPATSGYVFEIGGGSLELTRFQGRRIQTASAYSLGALRLTEQFLKHDPPSDHEIRKLVRHVQQTFAGPPRLGPGETLIGTGGTIRNLAKVDRRKRGYPIARLHGYTLQRADVVSLGSLLSSSSAKERSAIPGLSKHRADSIVGGVLAAQTIMELLNAEEMVVSGHGVREGIAISALGHDMPAVEQVRQASIGALVGRFTSWDARRAEMRVALSEQLQRRLAPEATEISELIRLAAYVLDIGRTIDYYNRLSHASMILLESDLHGFTHREIATLAALVQGMDERGPDLGRFGTVLAKGDHRPIEQGCAILAAANEIARRTPPGGVPCLEVESHDDALIIRVPPMMDTSAQILSQRLSRTLSQTIRVVPVHEGEA